MSIVAYWNKEYRCRWTDNDHTFGPFVYGYSNGYRSISLSLSSRGEEDPHSSLSLTVAGHTFALLLPEFAVPAYRRKVYPDWDEATVRRLGRNWYWDIDRRRFGFSYVDGFLMVYRGRSTMDSSTDRTWGKHLPWTQWRHVRHSFYGLKGEHVATIPDTGKPYLGDPGRWEHERAIREATPTVSFEFDDYDGERIIAKTKIEEREWHFGAGWFEWLSLFRAPKISRSLDIDFSAETGRRKGSWKGGTVGHAIEMRPGELHEAAFRRYCAEHEMTFAGSVPGAPS